MYPVIRVEGAARERGRQYGMQARDRVRRSIEAYEKVFAHYATWDWSTVLAEASKFHNPIRDFGQQYFDELAGIAEGAEVDLDDVVAINVRTEIMFAAKARESGATLPRVSECSSFAQVGDDGRVVVGQNWTGCCTPSTLRSCWRLRRRPARDSSLSSRPGCSRSSA